MRRWHGFDSRLLNTLFGPMAAQQRFCIENPPKTFCGPLKMFQKFCILGDILNILTPFAAQFFSTTYSCFYPSLNCIWKNYPCGQPKPLFNILHRKFKGGFLSRMWQNFHVYFNHSQTSSYFLDHIIFAYCFCLIKIKGDV